MLAMSRVLTIIVLFNCYDGDDKVLKTTVYMTSYDVTIRDRCDCDAGVDSGDDDIESNDEDQE